MKKTTRYTALLLVAVMLCALLAGCGGSAESGGEATPGEATPAVSTGGTVWTASFKALPEDTGYFSSVAMREDAIYVASTATVRYSVSSADPFGGSSESTVTSSSAGEYLPVLYRIDANDGSLAKLPDYVAPVAEAEEDTERELQGSTEISGLCLDPEGNLWVSETVRRWYFKLPDGFEGTEDEKYNYYEDGGSTYLLRKLSPTGAELLRADLSELAAGTEYFYVNQLVCDAAGNVCFTDSETKVWVYDKDGKPLTSAALDSWASGLVNLSDGSVAAALYLPAGFSLVPLDTATGVWGKPVSIDYPDGVYSGGGDYLFYYTYSSALWGWDAEKGEGVKLLNWLDCDMNQGAVQGLLAREDGSILCADYDYDSSAADVAVLTERPASEVAEKTILTLATMYLDSGARAQILKFNRTNEKYRIVVSDYSEYNTDENASGGVTKLNTEIISGKVPDIIDVTSLPARQYAAKGLLTDLYPLLDADAELSRDDLVQSILKAMETDGKLYKLSPGFGVMTVVGLKDKVGESGSWTLDELKACLAEQPEGTELFQQGFDRKTVMQYMCYMNMESYIDWQTGECSFDSPDFVSLLEFCALFNETFDYATAENEVARVQSGKQLLEIVAETEFESFQLYEAMFGGELSYKGFPSESGSGSIGYTDMGFAISSACTEKEAAWSFLRVFLTEDYQKNNVWSFPMNQKVFDARLKSAMTPQYEKDPVTGEMVEVSGDGYGVDGLTVWIYAITQEEADRMLELIGSVDRMMDLDDTVVNLILDEAAGFFAGDKTAETAAKNIQGRVSLYVNEQK